ncbi:MAG: hypothetical protein Q8N44_11190 [Rubrivivax sp.]|nr:hypothetical protein [Rubrivivax sp.]MDP3084238.1 hypothetical protein [Rubrivivax sp.]
MLFSSSKACAMTTARTVTSSAKPGLATKPKPVPKRTPAAEPAPVSRKVRAAAPKSAASQATPAKAAGASVTPKPAKQKLVRASFTIPRPEYAVLDALKARLVKLARPAKKSEVLRAGIKWLDTLPDAALLQALGAVPAIKTGRPGKAK